jgi:ligand-binding sensor domain-containing protein/anti-sigma regulatory factor (Ser/Thr protein kinase)
MDVATKMAPVSGGAMKLVRFCLFSICSLLSISAHGLSAEKRISQFAIDKWRTSDGLPEMAAQAITQTADGYLWIGTQEGLARFDGRRFVVFNHANSPGLRSDLIFALAEDKAGFLWIGTVGGAVVYSAKEGFRTLCAADGMPITRVRTIVRDRDGSVWIGGVGGIVKASAGVAVQAYTFNGSGSSEANAVSRAAIDDDGSLWVVSQSRLYELDDGKFNPVVVSDEKIEKRISRLFLSDRGELWLLSDDGRLYRRRNGAFERWWPEGLPATVQIRAMHEDRQKNIWIATPANGLFRSSESGLLGQPAEHSFAEVGLMSLFEDSSEDLWIGTLGRGLLRIRDGAFTTYTKEEGLSSDSVYSVVQDAHGSIWTGTMDGLSRADIDEVQHLTQRDGLASSVISSLAAADDGGIWAGTPGPSLAHIADGKVIRRFDLSPPHEASKVTAVLEDAQHQVWIGTDGAGTARLTSADTHYFMSGRDLQSDVVGALAQDKNGAIWVGTNAGVFRIDGEHLNLKPIPDDAIENKAISVLHFDARGVLWIGTFGTGLYSWDRDKLVAFNTSKALPEETINSVVTDAADNLWIGTNRGISRFSRGQLDAFRRDPATPLLFDRFTDADGMKVAETSGGAQPSATRSADGRLWFATSEGVAVIDPMKSMADEMPLEPTIESVRTNDSLETRSTAGIHLASAPPWIEFQFTAPELRSGSSIEFRYRLAGTDDTWSPAGPERVARYSNLTPGTHTFEVQARHEGHEWGSATASVALSMDPRFYQTPWFVLLLATSAITLIALAHHLRIQWVRMQSAVSDERRRIAGEIHDHLAQGFSGIAIQVDAAMRRLDRSPQLARPHLQVARDVAVSSLDEARRSVWNLQETGSSDGLAHSLRQACEQIVWGHPAKLLVAETGRAWALKPMTELQLTRVAEEAVHNAVEHGKAAEISISVSYSMFAVLLVISDDGSGYDADKADTSSTRGFGLKNIKHRVRQIRGSVDIVSSSGVGTKVTISVPRLSLASARSS